MTTQLFKFLKSAYIEDVLLRGTIRISTLSFFRAREGGRWIADPDEATTVVAAGGAVLASQSGQTVTDSWTPAGYGKHAVATDGGKIIFGEGTTIRYQHPDCFIFCVSEGERDPLTRAMCIDADEPYDSAVRILLPLELLAHRILYRSTIIELDDKPARRFFTSVASRTVSYDANEHHYTAGVAPVPSAFRKHPDFVAQSEARIVLTPIENLGRDWLTVRLPHPEKIFVEEFRGGPPLPR
jgi:hypothetical protein